MQLLDLQFRRVFNTFIAFIMGSTGSDVRTTVWLNMYNYCLIQNHLEHSLTF